MDGDTAPLKKLIELKQTFNTELYIDEAHALGIIGQNGEGLISKEDAPYVDYIIGTFGKTLGSSGAFIACSEKTNKHSLMRVGPLFIVQAYHSPF